MTSSHIRAITLCAIRGLPEVRGWGRGGGNDNTRESPAKESKHERETMSIYMEMISNASQ